MLQRAGKKQRTQSSGRGWLPPTSGIPSSRQHASLCAEETGAEDGKMIHEGCSSCDNIAARNGGRCTLGWWVPRRGPLYASRRSTSEGEAEGQSVFPSDSPPHSTTASGLHDQESAPAPLVEPPTAAEPQMLASLKMTSARPRAAGLSLRRSSFRRGGVAHVQSRTSVCTTSAMVLVAFRNPD